MEWVLCLGHAVIAALLLPFSRAGLTTRRRAIELAAVAGAGLGVALVGAGAAGSRSWRSVLFEPETSVPAGFAVACAWVVVGAVGAREGKVGDAALAGVAASGLALSAGGAFVVPSLLFWLCSSASLAALAEHGRARRAWPCIALSDAALCAAVAAYVIREDTWAFGIEPSGVAFWAFAAAAMLRGAVYTSGPGSAAGSGAAALAPLLAGGAVVLAARGGGAEPWIALLILALACAGVAAALWKDRISARVVAAWPVGLALAVCFVAPDQTPLAGAVATLAVAAGALMPWTGDRAGFERGLLVAAVPLTAGFGIVAAGATVSFERATDASSSLASAPWTVVAALLPAALAGGVVLAARAARTVSRELVPEAVLATWLLLGVSALAGFAPGVLGGDGSALGAPGGVRLLYATALAGGLGATFAVRRWAPAFAPQPAVAEAPHLDEETLARPLAWAVAAVGLAAAGAAGWLTVWGLNRGFL